MGCHALLPPRYLGFGAACVFVCVSVGFCATVSNNIGANDTTSTAISGSVVVQPTANTTDAKPPPRKVTNCTVHASSCTNCSQNMACAWCFSENKCLPKELRDERNTCDEDDWYYGDCDKPEKEEVLVYVLLGCALFLLLVVILLVLYIFFCKMPKNKDYEPVSQKDKRKARHRTPLMSKKVKPTGSRTDDLKKKYQLDG